MVSRESLAAVLRLARASRGISRDQLYAKAKIEPRHLQRLENAKSGVTLEMLGSISEALGFDPVALLIVASTYDKQIPIEERQVALQEELEHLDALGIISNMPNHFADGQLVAERAGWSVSDETVREALTCRDQGVSQVETAKKLGVHQSTVSRIWRKNSAK